MQEIQAKGIIGMFRDTETIQNNLTNKNLPSDWKPARLLNDPIQDALKFPLQTSRTCRGDWFDNILNWNPCPETYRFRATAVWKRALPERTSRVSTSNSFAIHPPAELHDEECLGRMMYWQLTFILPLGAGSSLIHVSFSVRATWLSTILLIHWHDPSVRRSSR